MSSNYDKTKNEFLDSLHNQANKEDWVKGIDLYQLKHIDKVTEYDGLYTAKVSDFSERSNEVRLRIRKTMSLIQWIECSCHKYRKHNIYCEHIIAFVLHLNQKDPSFFSKLSFRINASKQKKKGTLSNTNNSAEASAGESFLSHFKGSIIKAECEESHFQITIKDKLDLQSSHTIEIDSLANYLIKTPQKAKIFKRSKKFNLNETTVTLGLSIYEAKQDKLIIEKVATLPPKATTLSEGPGDKEEEEGKNEINSEEIIKLDKLCTLGEKYLYHKKLGFFPIKNPEILPHLKTAQKRQELSGDKAAIFFEKNYLELQKTFPIWMTDKLKNENKIKEPTLDKINLLKEEKGWFYLDPQYKIENQSVSMIALIDAYHNKARNYYKTPSGWLKVPEFIKDNRWELSKQKDKIAVNKLGILRLQAFAGKFDNLVGSKKVFNLEKEYLVNSPSKPKLDVEKSELNLRPYQEDGFKWLCWLYNNDLHGLLADDMGLGKTHQAMAFMLAIQKAKKKTCQFLVIAPTTVIDHWHNKIKTFSPNLRPYRYHGTKRDSSHIKDESLVTCLTSYGVLLRDIKILNQVKWNIVILDEAHYIKNYKTSTYKAACLIESDFRLCLTGTPMENNLSELKNLFDFLVPGYLGSKKFFSKEFMTPIIKENDPEKEHMLQKLIYPLKLRRTKQGVLKDLPKKIEDIRYCSLSEEQAFLYQKVLENKSGSIINQLEKGKHISYFHIFKILQLLKQICNHPALVHKTDNFQDHKSGKFELLKDLLQESLDSQQKIVIFTQYTKMVQYIESYCEQNKIKSISMTGLSKDRGKIIESFQEDPTIKVFIGSLLAGGVGIDLTAASVVIHYDRWWNPSKENQATDRVHRIGQKNSVQVFKLVTKGTLEEKIDQMIAEKAKNFYKFMNLDQTIFKSLTRENIISLLS